MNPTLRAYRVNAAGLEYITQATSTCAAIDEAIRLHGVCAATAEPASAQP